MFLNIILLLSFMVLPLRLFVFVGNVALRATMFCCSAL